MSQQSTGLSDDELALVVRVKVACAMLDISPPTFYQLINAGLIESYKEGAARKVTVASIKKYIADRIAADKFKSKVPRTRPSRGAGGAASPTIPISTL